MRTIQLWVTALILTLFVFNSGAEAQSVQPQKVHVGVYLRNVESIDLQNNNYYMDFLLWMRWKGPVDPTKSMRFTNLIDAWGLTMKPVFPKPKQLPDGSMYQRFACEGKFYHKFWLGTFPLDWQKVTLELEDSIHSKKQIIYIADNTSGVHEDLKIPGWRIDEIYNQVKDIIYPSNYGDTSIKGKSPYSHYRFGLKIYRPTSFFFFKIVPPIMIVLLCCFLIYLLKVEYVDARVSTVITALLTEVFLQLTFTASLPNVGLVVLLDQIFNFSYLVMFVILLECMIATRLYDHIEADGELLESEEDEATIAEIEKRIAANEAKMNRYERISFIGFPIVYIVGCFLITLAMRGTELFSLMF